MSSLDVLIGEWTVQIVHPAVPRPVSARHRFEWILDGRFVLQRVAVDHPDFPDNVAVLDADRCHYFDTRGVARTYQVTLGDGVFRLQREDPDFWQRFMGTISADGDTITGAWEMSHDNGATWEHDFDMHYRKVVAG